MQNEQVKITVLPNLTKHAQTRAQRRGIHPDELDALLSYGRRIHDHLGCLIYTFGDEDLIQLRQDVSNSLWQRLQNHRGIYAVTDSDGRVITTGHRFKRLVLNRSQTFNRSNCLRKKSLNKPDFFLEPSSWYM
jgi:hypothetical protein